VSTVKIRMKTTMPTVFVSMSASGTRDGSWKVPLSVSPSAHGVRVLAAGFEIATSGRGFLVAGILAGGVLLAGLSFAAFSLAGASSRLDRTRTFGRGLLGRGLCSRRLRDRSSRSERHGRACSKGS
jgi:hypothetical protein